MMDRQGLHAPKRLCRVGPGAVWVREDPGRLQDWRLQPARRVSGRFVVTLGDPSFI